MTADVHARSPACMSSHKAHACCCGTHKLPRHTMSSARAGTRQHLYLTSVSSLTMSGQYIQGCTSHSINVEAWVQLRWRMPTDSNTAACMLLPCIPFSGTWQNLRWSDVTGKRCKMYAKCAVWIVRDTRSPPLLEIQARQARPLTARLGHTSCRRLRSSCNRH